MKTISTERACVLDVACGTSEKFREFIQHVRPCTVLHGDNHVRLLALARDLGIDPAELSSYVWLQACIKEPEFVPLELVAQQFEIPLEKLRDYAHERARILYEQFGDLLLA